MEVDFLLFEQLLLWFDVYPSWSYPVIQGMFIMQWTECMTLVCVCVCKTLQSTCMHCLI